MPELGIVQLARRTGLRQFLLVIGVMDLALVLLFVIMADWNEFDSIREWWNQRVEYFDFDTSMVDMMLLSIVRFFILLLTAFRVPGFNFNIPQISVFVLCLVYFLAKTIEYSLPYIWATYCLISSCYLAVTLEILLLIYGYKLGSKSSPDYGGENDWESINQEDYQESDEAEPLILRDARTKAEPTFEESGFVTPPEMATPERSRASTLASVESSSEKKS